MAHPKSTTLKSHRDLFATPNWVFNRIQFVSGITFVHDVCAQKWSTKCPTWWTKRHNALKINWANEFDRLTPLWMNPPYSDLPAWTEKAAQAAADGLIIMGLVPDTPSSAWYQSHIHGIATSALRPDGRINFIRPNGKPADSNMWPSIFPIWTPWQTGQTSIGYFNRRPTGVNEAIKQLEGIA